MVDTDEPLKAVPFRKFTLYSRATPRFGEQAPPPALAEGWLVPNCTAPLPAPSVPPTCFSPAARVMYEPRFVEAVSAAAVLCEAVLPPPAASGAVPVHCAATWMQFDVTFSIG